MKHPLSPLAYHSDGRPGKIEVVPSKPVETQFDLSLAYTPGVAQPCRAIYEDPERAYDYTAKGNLVAVITNGTAVLGLGAIGPLAGKPVMEGKGVLFKKFADIDVFDLEVDATDPDEFIRVVAALEPTFGGINLEDLRGPDCFHIEAELTKRLSIPVFHDDQHGTAIISAAAFLNALELVGKKADEVRVVFSGAGAAGIGCAKLYLELGVKPENLLLCDSQGVLYEGRPNGLNPWKAPFVRKTTARTLADAVKDADVFVGVSVAGALTPEMLATMAPRPIVFAMANPDPEIGYGEARNARPDAIVATGRSDYPNQVNNVLGFPFIFRGALDVRARAITEPMKLAAVHALAALARQDVPDEVARAYGVDSLRFGPEYIIPKPFDPRVLLWVAPAVAQAAMESGAARRGVELDSYRLKLERLLGLERQFMRRVRVRASLKPQRIVFPEGTHDKILRACQIIKDERIAQPVLLGDPALIRLKIGDLGLSLGDVEMLDPTDVGARDGYLDRLLELRGRHGVAATEGEGLLSDPTVYGLLMVERGRADGFVGGIGKHYPETLRPALSIVRTREGVGRVCGVYVLIFKSGLYFLADTTVNIDPTAEELAEIAILTARLARRFEVEPRVALLSFSNFGSVAHARSRKVAHAVEILHRIEPGLMVDGEMQVQTALEPDFRHEAFPFSTLVGRANVLVFPDLESGNVAYQLLSHLGGGEAVGPILTGMRRPVHVLQTGFDVEDVVNMTAIAALDAQER
ncbi:MAG: NADP-dependent malic enzyme [Candidatus Eiseniibacteriota bacterium]